MVPVASKRRAKSTVFADKRISKLVAPCFPKLQALFPINHSDCQAESEEQKKELQIKLDEALNNGSLEIALSDGIPARAVSLPLPSCPYLSSLAIKAELNRVLEDGLMNGSLSPDQAVELRNYIVTYKMLVSHQQAVEAGSATPLELARDPEDRHGFIENVHGLFPVITQVFSSAGANVNAKMTKKDVESRIGKLLEEALNNGTLEKALSTSAQLGSIPAGYPGLAGISLKAEIKKTLEDALVSGSLSLNQAEELKNRVATYNMLCSRNPGTLNLDVLVIIDYTKLFHCASAASDSNGLCAASVTEEHPKKQVIPFFQGNRGSSVPVAQRHYRSSSPVSEDKLKKQGTVIALFAQQHKQVIPTAPVGPKPTRPAGRRHRGYQCASAPACKSLDASVTSTV